MKNSYKALKMKKTLIPGQTIKYNAKSLHTLLTNLFGYINSCEVVQLYM